MKGITPLIATILIIVIALGVAVFAFTWFTSSARSARLLVSEEEQARREASGKKIRINYLEDENLELISMGSVSVNTSDITVYMDNSLINCGFEQKEIAPGGKIWCTLPSVCIESIKVTAPGSSDIVFC